MQESLADLIKEAKQYYSLQKKYLRYTAAEQLTQVLSRLAIVITVAIVGFVAFVFLGIAFAHWMGATTGSLALGYLLYALVLLVLLLVFYLGRHRWVILPLARLMMKTFCPKIEEADEASEGQNG